MTTVLLRLLCVLWLGVAAHAGAWAAPPQVEAVEPPHWWTGFAEPRLQVLAYGPGVAEARVSVQGRGLTLAPRSVRIIELDRGR